MDRHSTNSTNDGAGNDSTAFSDDQYINLQIVNAKFNVGSVLARVHHSVLDLKKIIAPKIDYPTKRIRLIFGKSILKDDKPLSEYGIKSESKITLVILADNESAPTSSAASVKTSNPEDALLGMLSKSPIMKEMMKSPEFMQQLFSSNPQFKEMIKKNPEFKSIFEDSSYMEQFFSAAQNPELMKEMLRNNDRAISNLEMQPGGFNYLTQMYNNVQKPLESSDSADGMYKQPQLSNEQLSRMLNIKEPPKNKINTEPLPNPWAVRPQKKPLFSMMNHQNTLPHAKTPQRSSAHTIDPFGYPTTSSGYNSRIANFEQRQRSRPSKDVLENTRNLSNLKISSSGKIESSTATAPTSHSSHDPTHDANMSISSSSTFSAAKIALNNSIPAADINMGGIGTGSNSNSSSDSDSQFKNATSAHPFTTLNSSETEPSFSRHHSSFEIENSNFETKMQMLVDMGFTNQELNQRALEITNGDVNLAVEWLFRQQ